MRVAKNGGLTEKSGRDEKEYVSALQPVRRSSTLSMMAGSGKEITAEDRLVEAGTEFGVAFCVQSDKWTDHIEDHTQPGWVSHSRCEIFASNSVVSLCATCR